MGCRLNKEAEEQVVENQRPIAAKPIDTTDGKEEPNNPGRLQKIQTEDIRDKYIIGKKLGSGSFGQVREAVFRSAPSAPVRAVKIIEYDGEEGEWSNLAMFKTEVVLLQNLDNANIIKYYDFYEDPSFLYVVMERCCGGEVFQKIRELRRFGEMDAAAIGRQMLSALAYIHRLHIVHRDIKAENFLFLDIEMSSPLKMIDFGMSSKVIPGNWLEPLCGSPHYLSPELIGQKYNEITDIWAFGVLMYLILFGRYPHEGKRPEDIMWKVLTEKISWVSDKVRLSQAAIFFLGRVLEPNWKFRYSAETALQDSWITGKHATEKKERLYLPPEVCEAAHNASKIRFTKSKHLKAMDKKLEEINSEYAKGVCSGRRLTLDDTPLNPERLLRAKSDTACDKTQPPVKVEALDSTKQQQQKQPSQRQKKSIPSKSQKRVSAKLSAVVPAIEDDNARALKLIKDTAKYPIKQPQTRQSIEDIPGMGRHNARKTSSRPDDNLSQIGNINKESRTSFAEAYAKLYSEEKGEIEGEIEGEIVVAKGRPISA